MQDEVKQVPRHIAIIMDGNGRWAKRRGLPRLEGHRAGANSVRKVVEECRRIGVRYLTLYSFSSENWNREATEVSGLMDLFKQYLESEMKGLVDNGIRLRAIGDIDRLPFAVRKLLERDIDRTISNEGLDLILAMSYGSRDELVMAIKHIAQRVKQGELDLTDIDANLVSNSLWTRDIPDPDLVIRTSGEQRVSNFLLWQIAYSEFIFSDQYWPDFNEESLHACIDLYNSRERRFGRSSEQVQDNAA